MTYAELGKRAHLALKQAEAQVAAYQAKLADIEARIQSIAPDLQLPVRFRERNSIFARGELHLERLIDAIEAVQPGTHSVVSIQRPPPIKA